MDKLLLTAFLTALAGFITFVLSIVKLVNEKESTTTEYRQNWTNSVRNCLASLIAKLNAIAPIIENHSKSIEIRASLKEPTEKREADEHKRSLDYIESSLKSSLEARRELRKEIYEAYALVRLHFKPNDVSFSRIEHKFDTVMQLIEALEVEKTADKRAATKVKIHAEVNEITGYCRDILKTEWETVKRGEPTYQKTKLYSIYGGVVTLFILTAIGLYAAIAAIGGGQLTAANARRDASHSNGLQPASTTAILEQQRPTPNCSTIEISVNNSNQGMPAKAVPDTGPQVAKHPLCDHPAGQSHVN